MIGVSSRLYPDSGVDGERQTDRQNPALVRLNEAEVSDGTRNVSLLAIHGSVVILVGQRLDRSLLQMVSA